MQAAGGGIRMICGISGVERNSMAEVRHLTLAELEAGIADIRRSPRDEGPLRLIVRRPKVGMREALEEGYLDLVEGLLGDNWKARGASNTVTGSSHPDMQLNIMNARAIALVAGGKEHWPLAGDQLFIDLDLSADNLPPGTKLTLGSAVVEVTAIPHTGCHKFKARFGLEAMRFVNSAVGKELQLRGINAKVVRSGVIRIADRAKKIDQETWTDLQESSLDR
jgi:hypothetical protein